jgi:hypothetical protein
MQLGSVHVSTVSGEAGWGLILLQLSDDHSCLSRSRIYMQLPSHGWIWMALNHIIYPLGSRSSCRLSLIAPSIELDVCVSPIELLTAPSCHHENNQRTQNGRRAAASSSRRKNNAMHYLSGDLGCFLPARQIFRIYARRIRIKSAAWYQPYQS